MPSRRVPAAAARCAAGRAGPPCPRGSDFVRAAYLNPIEPQRCCVVAGELQGPLVDVDGVDVGRGGEHPEREGDRSPPAAEVQERSREGRVRDLGEQDRRAHIDAVRRKDASRARDRDAATGQVNGEGASLLWGGRRRGEVVLVLAHRP